MIWLIGLSGLAIGGVIGWLLAAVRVRPDQAVHEADLRAAAATAEAGTLRVELGTRKQEAEEVRTHLRDAEAAAAAAGARELEMRQRCEEQRELLQQAELK